MNDNQHTNHGTPGIISNKDVDLFLGEQSKLQKKKISDVSKNKKKPAAIEKTKKPRKANIVSSTQAKIESLKTMGTILKVNGAIRTSKAELSVLALACKMFNPTFEDPLTELVINRIKNKTFQEGRATKNNRKAEMRMQRSFLVETLSSLIGAKYGNANAGGDSQDTVIIKARKYLEQASSVLVENPSKEPLKRKSEERTPMKLPLNKRLDNSDSPLSNVPVSETFSNQFNILKERQLQEQRTKSTFTPMKLHYRDENDDEDDDDDLMGRIYGGEHGFMGGTVGGENDENDENSSNEIMKMLSDENLEYDIKVLSKGRHFGNDNKGDTSQTTSSSSSSTNSSNSSNAFSSSLNELDLMVVDDDDDEIKSCIHIAGLNLVKHLNELLKEAERALQQEISKKNAKPQRVLKSKNSSTSTSSTSQKACKECSERAVAGNYGYCLKHRDPETRAITRTTTKSTKSTKSKKETTSKAKKATVNLETSRPIMKKWREVRALDTGIVLKNTEEILLYPVVGCGNKEDKIDFSKQQVGTSIQLGEGLPGSEHGIFRGPSLSPDETKLFQEQGMDMNEVSDDAAGEGIEIVIGENNISGGFKKRIPGTKTIQLLNTVKGSRNTHHKKAIEKRPDLLNVLFQGDGEKIESKGEEYTLVVKQAKLNYYSNGSVGHHHDIRQWFLNTYPGVADARITLKLIYRLIRRFLKGAFLIFVPTIGWCVAGLEAGESIKMYQNAMSFSHQHINCELSEDKRHIIVCEAKITGSAISDHCVV